MSAIIPDIDTLKQVVKINASIPWESIEPFINDARDIYLEPQVGNVLVELAEKGSDQELAARMLRVLGPLSLSLATDELGVQYGDSGITVDNVQGKRSPANEAKIAAAKANLFFRGMQALDRLLDYLSRHPAKYPDYADHLSVISSVPCFIRSAREFQDTGLVDIDCSTLTYRAILPTLRQLQVRHLQELLPPGLYGRLLADTGLSAKESVLKELCIRYLANRAAELYTSQSSRSRRGDNGTRPEYRPVIRPLYNDMDDTGNFFGKQADYYAGKITGFLAENAGELEYRLPSCWDDLTPKQLRFLVRLTQKEISLEHLKIYMMLYCLNARVANDNRIWGRTLRLRLGIEDTHARLRIGRKKYDLLPEDVIALSSLMEFLIERERTERRPDYPYFKSSGRYYVKPDLFANPYPKVYARLRRFTGPDDGLYDITFEQYVYLQTYLDAMREDAQKIDWALACVWHRGKSFDIGRLERDAALLRHLPADRKMVMYWLVSGCFSNLGV